MIKLFSWLLRRFLTSFGILIAVQLVTYALGLTLILSTYEAAKIKQYEKDAANILNNSDLSKEKMLLTENSFFVFSTDKELIFSNKGMGRSISDEDLFPVYEGNKIIGYFHVGQLGFAETRANQIFLVSIIILGVFSFILSAIIGFLAARLSALKITEPFNQIKIDIHEITNLKQIPARDFKIAELASISQDISEVSKNLYSQEEYKQKWLNDLSHDLRTPLSGLKAQLEAISDGVLTPTPERFKRYFYEIERLESLAASIGVLTSIETRKNIDKKEISISHFADMLISPFELDITQRNINLNKNLVSGEILIDEKLMLRAAGNILENALKYMDDHGCLWINIDNRSIEISNDGPEIPENQRDLIFTRLFRGDAARTTSGSGLGLSISREIIKLHGGRIEVGALQLKENLQKEEIRGVTFKILL